MNNPHVSRVLPGTIKEIGKALLYRSDIVEAVLKCADLKEKLIEKVMITLSEECKHLCGTKFNSLLRKCSPPQLLEFSMEAVMSEWQHDAPLLHRFLTTAASSSNVSDTTDLHGWLHFVEGKKYSHVCFSTYCWPFVISWKCS